MRCFTRLAITSITCFLMFPVYADTDLRHVRLHDLFFGEVLFDAYQNKYFEALSKLDNELNQYSDVDEKKLDPLYRNIGQAKFSVGDIELQYRMTQRAGDAIQAVLGAGVDVATRNRAALQLGRLYYKKGEPERVLYALNLIQKEPEKSQYEKLYSLDILRRKKPDNFKQKVAYLRALAYLDTGQFNKSVNILQSLKNEEIFKGYVLYNLGTALISDGREEQGIRVFDQLGQIESNKKDVLALKDKANLKLAYIFVEKRNAKLAKKYFERIRLQGPFSNRALLGSGWVSASQGHYERALVPWTLLSKRSKTDAAVQEAMMAVPYAYSKLKAYGKSANLYSRAMDVFSHEVHRLDESIKSIREGNFLKALLDKHAAKDKNWVVSLRKLPDTPETRYLLDLLASNNFQQSYKNYIDLSRLRHYLVKWLNSLDAYDELIDLRRKYQQPLLPVIEDKFRKIDARMKLRLEQRNNLNTKINNMLIAPRPEYLATANERIVLDHLARIKQYLVIHPQLRNKKIDDRIARLNGIILWRVRSEFNQRLTDAYNHLHQLDGIIEILKLRYNSFIRTRQAATQSYEGYDRIIRQLRTHLHAEQKKLDSVMAGQGRLIEVMAGNELDARRKRLEAYQIKARFALAENYDRATKSQQEKESRRQHRGKTDKSPGKVLPPGKNKQRINNEGPSLDEQLKNRLEDNKNSTEKAGKNIWSEKNNDHENRNKKRKKSPWIKNAVNPAREGMQ